MIEKDVVVVGSGGAGLSAAVVAACEGLDVLVVEKSDYFGGTTALSGGGIWIPMSAPAIDAGFHDSLDAARTYVRKVVGPTIDLDQLDRFLETAPKALDYLMSKTDVQFALEPGFPDYQPDIEGAVDDGLH